MQITPQGKRGLLILVVVGILGAALWYVANNEGARRLLMPGTPPPSKHATTASSHSTTSSDEGPTKVMFNTWPGFAGAIAENGGKESDEFIFELNDNFDATRAAWKNGDCDVLGFVTIDAFTLEVSGLQSYKPKVFCQIDRSDGGDVIVGAPGINTINDVVGQTFAFAPMTPSHTLVWWALEAGSKKITDVQFVPVTDGVQAADFFNKRQVKVAAVWAPDDEACLAAVPGSKRILSTKGKDIIYDVWLAKEETFNKKRARMERLVEMTLTGNAKINSDPAYRQRAAELLSAAVNQPMDWCLKAMNGARYATYGDNVNFFNIKGNYPGMSGEKIYNKMSVAFSKMKNSDGVPYITGSVPAWRTIAEPSIIRQFASQFTAPEDAAEARTKFAPATSSELVQVATATKHVTINFASGSSELSPLAMDKINTEVADFVVGLRSMRVRIEGNTDNVGGYEMNVQLSRQRAEAVAHFLAAQYQLDPDKFIIVGNGPNKPVADNGSSTGRALNRRTDFEFLGN